MSMWERKQAGEVVDAIYFYANGQADAPMRAELTRLSQRAIDVERSLGVNAAALSALQREVCAFCKSHALCTCSGAPSWMGCNFMAIAKAGSLCQP